MHRLAYSPILTQTPALLAGSEAIFDILQGKFIIKLTEALTYYLLHTVKRIRHVHALVQI